MNEQAQVEQPTAPTAIPETLDQRMGRLTKELNEWCDTNNVSVVIVAVGKKSNQASPIVDWQPDSHVFVHALAPRQQQ